MEALLNTPDDRRDVAWEDQFLQALSTSSVRLLSPEPQVGPDGWPYLMVETDPTATEPAQQVMQWLATRGIGLVINPQKEYPDYILTYGMLWSFKETGVFIHRQSIQNQERLEIGPTEIKNAGTPTPQYLPQYARQILREFFRDQGVLNPRILVLTVDGQHYDLAFSLESLGNPPEHERSGVAEAISWFLPPHYSLLLVSEKGLPEFSAL